ncbi:type II secretion system minor pseudopilin GspI [Pseudomonas sp. App30]|uniref:type II secretion system minor pseudopilin GspI n=1 Tax=Pseudomonas sp. App30 TaxID=3068990 RepID=UPI003A805A01
MSNERGFTLLEMMVALAVFAALATAVLGASQFSLRQASHLQERQFAQWILDNHLAQVWLEAGGPGSLDVQRIDFAGRRWQLQARHEGDSLHLQLRLEGDESTLHTLHAWVPRGG